MRFRRCLGFVLMIAMMMAMVNPAGAADSRALNTRGNSTGNAIAYGVAAEENGKIFYVVQGAESISGIYMTTSTLTKGKIIRKVQNASALNAINGWVYFESDAGYSRMKQDGTGLQNITKDAVDYVNIVGTNIFYKCMTEGKDYGKLITMKVSGTGRKVISNDQVGAINAFEKIVYYMNNSDNQKPYSVGIDGKNRKKVSNQIMFRPCFAEDGYVYYSDPGDGYKLYRAKYDGSGKKKIYNAAVDYPNYSGGYVYFTAGVNSYRIKSGSTTAEKLAVKGTTEDDLPAVLTNGIFRVAQSLGYPQTVYYGIKSKLTEIVFTRPDPELSGSGDATVDALLCNVDYDNGYVEGGELVVKITGTDTGRVKIRYGFGVEAYGMPPLNSSEIAVREGKSYTVTIPIEYGSPNISSASVVSIYIGKEWTRSEKLFFHGAVTFGELIVEEEVILNP